MGEMGDTGDSNGVGFVRTAGPKEDAFVAGLGETWPWETPALALRAAAASMMRRAAARFRASGVADAEPDGEASVGASAGLRVPASGDICREGLGVEVADADREGLGGGENTKFVTGSLAALGERRRAGLAAAMMRRAAATLSIAGEARRPSAPPSGVDGNGEGGGFRGVNAQYPDALASAETTVSSSVKRGGYAEALSTRGGDAGGGVDPPSASSAARSAAAFFAASESQPSCSAVFVFGVSAVETIVETTFEVASSLPSPRSRRLPTPSFLRISAPSPSDPRRAALSDAMNETAPPESGLAVAAARLFVESSPSPNANVEPEVSRDATGDVASVSARAGSGAGSGVGSNARHGALEGVFVLGGLACV